jgi:peptidoglycan/xylan/chitin deacetylase (PgdA/CDA1 family)
VTLTAEEVVNYLHGGDPPGKKIVAIQFDDGWKSGQLALPVLDNYSFLLVVTVADLGLLTLAFG